MCAVNAKAEGNYWEICIANRNGVITRSREKAGLHYVFAPLATLCTILFLIYVLNIHKIAAVNDATFCKAK